MSLFSVRFGRTFITALVWLAAVAGLLAPSAVADPVDCDALAAQIEAHNHAQQISSLRRASSPPADRD